MFELGVALDLVERDVLAVDDLAVAPIPVVVVRKLRAIAIEERGTLLVLPQFEPQKLIFAEKRVQRGARLDNLRVRLLAELHCIVRGRDLFGPVLAAAEPLA